MIQIGNKTADAYYVGNKLVSQIYKGSTKIYPLENQIPKSIKDSMMLWYDIKRQGATNESMKANPVIKDLSGNGHDAACHNFAWSGESGIGGYNQSPLSDSSYKKDVVPVQGGTWNSLYSKSDYNKNKSWTIRVTCDTKPFTEVDGVHVFTRSSTTGETHRLSDNIINNTPLTISAYDGEILEYGVWINLDNLINNAVTIEILPEHPNALVSDGVDDYALVEGLPLLTKDRGFTVVYKRTILGDPNDAYKVFAAKRQGTQDGEHWGAFVLEKGPNVYPFGQINEITINTDDIGYMTPTSYCGQPIQSGNQVDYDHLALFCGADNGNEKQSVALYSFILFNRTLTNDEIDWVKTNLIEGDTKL